MPSSGGKEKKTCQAEETSQTEAQNVLRPSLSQERVALHGLFNHCTLCPPTDTAQQDASERPPIFLSLVPIAHFVLSFGWAWTGPEIPGLPGPAGTLPSLICSGRKQGSSKERREQERLSERDPGPLIL